MIENIFEFKIIQKGIYLLKLPHYNSIRNITFDELKTISLDLKNYLKIKNDELSIKTISKGSLIVLRASKKLCDNDNTIYSDIFNILKRTNIIASDLPNDFSINYFGYKTDDMNNDFIFIFDKNKNPLKDTVEYLLSIITKECESIEKSY